MIDKKLESYYNVLLSIFFGIILIFFLHNLYEMPRSIVITREFENFAIETNDDLFLHSKINNKSILNNKSITDNESILNNDSIIDNN